MHIAEIFRQPKATVTPSRVGLTPGVLFDMSRNCWDLDVQANAERTCEYLRTERPVLLLGSPKCRAFMNLRSVSRRDPKFSKTLEAGLCHLKSLMEIYHWQNEQGRCFLHEDPHYQQESEHQGVANLESLVVRVINTKQFGTFMTSCSPIVEEFRSSSTNNGVFPVSFATSVLRGLRRTLEEVTGAMDSTEAGSTVEEECPVRKLAGESGHFSYDDITGLPLDPKLVAEASKEELMFMRKLQVFCQVPASYLDESGLKAVGTRWVHTNKGDAANPSIRARLVAQETKRVSELTPEDAMSTFAATPPLQSLKVMLSRCMTGKRRTPAEKNVLGFYDIQQSAFPQPCTSYDCDQGAQRGRRLCEWERSSGQRNVRNEGRCTTL